MTSLILHSVDDVGFHPQAHYTIANVVLFYYYAVSITDRSLPTSQALPSIRYLPHVYHNHLISCLISIEGNGPVHIVGNIQTGNLPFFCIIPLL